MDYLKRICCKKPYRQLWLENIITPATLFYGTFFSLFLLMGTGLAQVRTIEKEKELTSITVSAPFDSLQAKKMLEEGTAEIRGVVGVRPRNSFGGRAPLAALILGKDQDVMLFPATNYIETWIKERNANKNKKVEILISKEVYKYRIETKSNSKGEFRFTKMKPGRYYLLSFQNVYIEKKGVYSSGQWHDHISDYVELIEDHVNIDQAGQVMNVKLNQSTRVANYSRNINYD